jgi:hypothetical protein
LEIWGGRAVVWVAMLWGRNEESVGLEVVWRISWVGLRGCSI